MRNCSGQYDHGRPSAVSVALFRSRSIFEDVAGADKFDNFFISRIPDEVSAAQVAKGRVG